MRSSVCGRLSVWEGEKREREIVWWLRKLRLAKHTSEYLREYPQSLPLPFLSIETEDREMIWMDNRTCTAIVCIHTPKTRAKRPRALSLLELGCTVHCVYKCSSGNKRWKLCHRTIIIIIISIVTSRCNLSLLFPLSLCLPVLFWW